MQNADKVNNMESEEFQVLLKLWEEYDATRDRNFSSAENFENSTNSNLDYTDLKKSNCGTEDIDFDIESMPVIFYSSPVMEQNIVGESGGEFNVLLLWSKIYKRGPIIRKICHSRVNVFPKKI